MVKSQNKSGRKKKKFIHGENVKVVKRRKKSERD